MLDVSNFELIAKPLTPVPPSGTPAPVDTVIQGYFLQITNLETVPYRYRLDFIIEPPGGGAPERGLAGNHTLITDVGATNNSFASLAGTSTSSVFRSPQFTVPGLSTAKVALLPAVFGPGAPAGTPNIEVRGFVRLRLPRNPGPFPSIFGSTPQSATPVKVMLTPQNRATFLDAAGAINGQAQASLPTASGAAVNSLASDPLFSFPVTVARPETDISDLLPAIEALGAEERSALTAALLSGIDVAGSDLDGFNRMMGDRGLRLAPGRERRREPA